MQQASLCLWAPLSTQLSSGLLCSVVPHSCLLGVCPRCCHHASLCSALLQPFSHATVWPRALGRALYRESIATYCPHACSEQANQGQMRILATGTFTLSTTPQGWDSSAGQLCGVDVTVQAQKNLTKYTQHLQWEGAGKKEGSSFKCLPLLIVSFPCMKSALRF